MNPKKKQITHEEFVVAAIRKLRTDRSRGIHTVYSGFNQAFRAYFGPEANPVIATKALAEAGKIEVRACRGGAMIYLPGEAPVLDPAAAAARSAAATLAKLGLVA